MIHKKRKRVQKAGKKFELKHLIRLVFWRKKPCTATDIGVGIFFRFCVVAGAWAYRTAGCAFFGGRACV